MDDKVAAALRQELCEWKEAARNLSLRLGDAENRCHAIERVSEGRRLVTVELHLKLDKLREENADLRERLTRWAPKGETISETDSEANVEANPKPQIVPVSDIKASVSQPFSARALMFGWATARFRGLGG